MVARDSRSRWACAASAKGLVTLALRGVPQAAISQLMGHADPRTTAIYTTVASSALIGVLDDAGLL